MPTPREIASIPAKDFADELVMLITNAGLLADEKLSYKLYLLIKPVIHTALSSRDREVEELERKGDHALYEQIIGLLPQQFRQHSYGAADGVRRLVGAYEKICQECHEWRHGHRTGKTEPLSTTTQTKE